MKLIVITTEQRIEKEAEAIDQLFAEGLETLHLRKPSASVAEMEQLIRQIDPSFHTGIVLHDHFELLRKYRLKGMHLNRRNPERLPSVTGTVSRSCHSLEEVEQSASCDYVFLSPVFDSVSKQGYKQGFTHEELFEASAQSIIHPGVIALGGITSQNIPQVAGYGFGGVAVLGTLWQNFYIDKDVHALAQRFIHLQTICQTI